MAGKGETYKRQDGKYGFRVKAANGEQVASEQIRGEMIEGQAADFLSRVRGEHLPGTEHARHPRRRGGAARQQGGAPGDHGRAAP